MQDFIYLAFFLPCTLLSSQLIMSQVTKGTYMEHRQQKCQEFLPASDDVVKARWGAYIHREHTVPLGGKRHRAVGWDVYSWGRLPGTVQGHLYWEQNSTTSEAILATMAQRGLSVQVGDRTEVWELHMDRHTCVFVTQSAPPLGSWGEWSKERFLSKSFLQITTSS